MGNIRFWRRIRIFSNIYLNISKRGISFTFGPRGFKFNANKNGHRTTVDLPGTGLYFTNYDKWKLTQKKQEERQQIDINKLKEQIKD